MVIGTVFAGNMAWAFSTLKSMFLYSLIYYLVVVQFVDSSFKAWRYVQLYFLSNLSLVLIGIANKAIVLIPMLADENEFALLCNTLIPFAFFLSRETDAVTKKICYRVAMAILILGTVMSFSRGGLLGLCAVMLFLYWNSKHKVALFMGISLLVSAAILFVPSGDPAGSHLGGDPTVRHGEHRGELDLGKYWADMLTILSEGADEGTGKERVVSWIAGWDMFVDNPIFGVGPSNYRYWIYNYYESYGSKSAANMWGRVAHSVYFTLLPETGLVGTILFAMMLWNCIKDHRYLALLDRRGAGVSADTSDERSEHMRTAIRRLHSLSLAYCGAMIGFLVSGAFISVLWYGYFWTFCSFWAMTKNAARETERELWKRPSTIETRSAVRSPDECNRFDLKGR